MRRVLAILKYAPAVLCVFIAAGCVLSQFRYYIIEFPLGRGWIFAELGEGTIGEQWIEEQGSRQKLAIYEANRVNPKMSLGRLDVWHPSWIKVPLVLLFTLLLPAAVLPFCRFRFPLWAWFAWVALLAAEFSYLTVPFTPVWKG